MNFPVHEATTAQLGAAYPFVSSSPLPCSSVFVGRDLFGGAFVHDPFELYAAGAITNPNSIVIGQIGRGKSALMKSYLYRQAAFGRRVIVLDPKGEYGSLARALGVDPLRLVPGGAIRLNPLQIATTPDEGAAERERRRLSLLTAIAEACLGRFLSPGEHSALQLALGHVASKSTPTLSDVVSSLLAPTSDGAWTIGSSTEELRADGRDVALELRRLISGEFGGMFDGVTTSGVNLSSAALFFDISALYRSAALGALLACIVACLEGSFTSAVGQTILVIDEAWSILSNLGAAKFLQSSWKLARARGVANVAVLHRLSDLAAAGSAGSAQMKLAEGLLADCETVVCYAQNPSELAVLVELLGLDRTQAELVTRLRRGVALWRVGQRFYLVEHRLSAVERAIVDSDEAMATK